MARSEYTVDTSAAVALVAATPKTVLAVYGSANVALDLLEFSISFDGVTASAVPVLWELCLLTAASNSTPGTGNTSETANIRLFGGPGLAANGMSAFSASTTEPTVLTRRKSGLLSPVGSLLINRFPLSDSPDGPFSQGFALRLNAPAAVNARAEFTFARA